MKFNLVSDLHLEFCDMHLPGGEHLLLAGDILPVDYLRLERTDAAALKMRARADRFFTEEVSKYGFAYMVMGNHEHYHGDVERDYAVLNRLCHKHNVILLENLAINLMPGLRLFGATLWTDFRQEDYHAMNTARMNMNDFSGMIKNGGKRFNAEDSVIEHKRTKQALDQDMRNNPDQDYLVMTHHCPSYKSIHPKYGNDPLNYAFSSDLSELILDHPRIKTWVHGHTHSTFDYKIGDCRVMCNPRGYTRSENTPPENADFNPNFSFEVLHA